MNIRETLASRERVNRTLRREPVDRLPIDLGSHPSTGISAFAYWELKQKLGLTETPVEVWDLPQMLARVEIPVLERFHCDLICLSARPDKFRDWTPRGNYRFLIPAAAEARRNADGDWFFEQPDTPPMRMPDGGYFFDGGWLSNWETCSFEESLRRTTMEAEILYKETPYALNYTGYASGGPQVGGFFGGLEQAIALLTDPVNVFQAIEAWSDDAIRNFDIINKNMGQYLSLISLNSDLGMQNAPYLRPEWFEEFYFNATRRFCDHVHQNSDIKIFLHSCGSIRPLIALLIEAGIDVLNPVQISAVNMDPSELKNEFGDRLIFWGGGCDTQNVLGNATPEEVAENVRTLIAVFKPHGGFVFNQVHNILGNVPAENIISMLDTAYNESFY